MSSSTISRRGAVNSRGQPSTSFPAAAFEDGASLTRPRPPAEPVLALPAASVGLISTLHGNLPWAPRGAGIRRRGYLRLPVIADTHRGGEVAAKVTSIRPDLQRLRVHRPLSPSRFSSCFLARVGRRPSCFPAGREENPWNAITLPAPSQSDNFDCPIAIYLGFYRMPEYSRGRIRTLPIHSGTVRGCVSFA